MNKYSDGKVYRIVNSELNLVYYGSTTQTLNKRFYQHRKDSFDPLRKNTSKRLFQTTSIPYIELLELVNCENRIELETIERHYIENHLSGFSECVNKVIPLRTNKEYYLDNCESIKQKYRDYYAINKDDICLKKRQFYIDNKERLTQKFNCPCGGSFTPKHRTRHFRSIKHIKFLETDPVIIDFD